jgi:hypothetical protein
MNFLVKEKVHNQKYDIHQLLHHHLLKLVAQVLQIQIHHHHLLLNNLL